MAATDVQLENNDGVDANVRYYVKTQGIIQRSSTTSLAELVKFDLPPMLQRVRNCAEVTYMSFFVRTQ